MNIEEIPIPAFCRMLKKRVDEKKDNVIAITAYPGFGKSTLAIHIAQSYKPTFSLKDDILYFVEGEQLEDKYINSRKDMMIVDEATKSVHKYDWMTNSSKNLKTDFDANRMFGNTVIFCMPRITDFSPYFRSGRIYYWIQIIERGIAILYKRTNNHFAMDPWYLLEGEKTVRKAMTKSGGMGINALINLFAEHPCFQGYIPFRELSPEVWNEYERYKIASREEYARQKIKQMQVMNSPERGLNRFGQRYLKERTLLIAAMKKANPDLTWEILSHYLGHDIDSLRTVHSQTLSSELEEWIGKYDFSQVFRFFGLPKGGKTT